MSGQSFGIIGGADGPTAILVAGQFPWALVAIGVAVTAAVAVTLILLFKNKK